MVYSYFKISWGEPEYLNGTFGGYLVQYYPKGQAERGLKIEIPNPRQRSGIR